MEVHRLSLINLPEITSRQGVVVPTVDFRDAYDRAIGTVHRVFPQRNRQKLQTLVSESQLILAKASTVFPFDLFPDTLTVDENKINIIQRGLLTEQIHSFFY